MTPGRFNLTFSEDPGLKLTDLRGVGRKTAERLGERGIFDKADLLLFIPRKYRPIYRHVAGPDMVRQQAGYAQFYGRIARVNIPPRHSRAPVEVHLQVDGAIFKLIWFNMNRQGFTRLFRVDKWLLVEGKVEWERGGTPTMAHPTFDAVGAPPAEMPEAKVDLEAVYKSMEGINDSTVRKALEQAAAELLPRAVDIVPRQILERHNLPTVRRALETIHQLREFGDAEAFRRELNRARNRLVYEEFYTLQKKLAHDYVTERRAARAPQCTERELGRSLVRNLPFSLTGDQSEAIATIADDLKERAPMRRLLQGDVGSGKTVVAFMAAAICIGSGQQVAMMAPTDILAKQHLRRAREMFEGLPVNIGLLTGSQSASERDAVLERLRDPAQRAQPAEQSLFDDGDADASSRRIDLVIGTHALFQDDVDFDELGLVIVDEQHKFGVEQRQALLEKGRDPHFLAMTATPIPRSLAHAVFGDLDLTVIREKPPGRKPIRTFLRDRSRAQKVYEYVRDRIEETGEQAYFVYPMVEASEAVAGRENVTDSAEALANGPLSSLRVGILHGRMDATTKDRTMQRFADGEIQVLCATTVVEVGMDVTNATLMVIESPEVFGLSQLHQLRGRVGRGSADSMCILLAGYALTADAEERLGSFSGTEDGFELAEVDLEIRGPGEFLGVRQAGLPEFRFADVLRDAELIQLARRDARREVLGDAGA
ncbi:MAG: ATP-dependent DNA helicase RecG [Persicimonas sp.]